jgi:hypothetical protein
VLAHRGSDAGLATDGTAAVAVVPPTTTLNPGNVGARAAVDGRAAAGFAENAKRAVSFAANGTGANKIIRNNFLNILFPLLYALTAKAIKTDTALRNYTTNRRIV